MEKWVMLLIGFVSGLSARYVCRFYWAMFTHNEI